METFLSSRAIGTMKSLALSLFTAFFCLQVCADDHTPGQPKVIVADPFQPAHFTSLYLENDQNGRSTVIQLAGAAVNYKVTKGDTVLENVTVNPDGDAWFQFIQGLNTAKVYKWAATYEYPGQGESWVIDFSTDDRKFSSSGTNEYPKNGDEAQPAADPKSGPSVPFELFWQAALRLVGKTPNPAAAK